MTPGLAAFKLAFQLSPIIMVDGIAKFMGGYLPLIAITEALNFPLGILSGGTNIELDRFFANYEALPGASLTRQAIGHYPFANQAVAANATIQQPQTVSMKMTVVAQNRFGYFSKLPTMMAVGAALKQHNVMGGTYIVATPSWIYTNALFMDMREIGGHSGTKQPQTAWQLDFEVPLLTLDQAEQALSNLPKKMESGVMIEGQPAYSGISPSINPPLNVSTPQIIPAQAGSIVVQPLPAPPN